jgi:hypothetical protein
MGQAWRKQGPPKAVTDLGVVCGDVVALGAGPAVLDPSNPRGREVVSLHSVAN